MSIKIIKNFVKYQLTGKIIIVYSYLDLFKMFKKYRWFKIFSFIGNSKECNFDYFNNHLRDKTLTISIKFLASIKYKDNEFFWLHNIVICKIARPNAIGVSAYWK